MKWLLWLLGVFSILPACAQNKFRHTVLIHEFFPDPTPSRGLPNAEYIELRNVSGNEIQLRNWRVINGSTSGKINANFILKPDSLVILASSGSIGSLQSFGSCISLIPFPALNNEEDTLLLLNEKDSLVHAIAYNNSWYRNPVKKEGGWSLEMIDASQPCLQSVNWIASSNPSGGSPGKPNQTAGFIRDTSAPWITSAYMEDSLNISIVMSEQMNDNVIDISPGLDILHQQWLPPLFQLLSIRLRQELQRDSLVILQMNNLKDCSGNKASTLSATIGRFARLISKQCVINEVLFDPPPGGSDYIELYNRSPEPIDVAQLMLATRNANGTLSQPRPISSLPYPLLPNQYLVITEDSSWIHRYYSPGQIRLLETELPSFPDDEGTIVFLNAQGLIVDELHYSTGWHHPLISNPQGVSLERVNPMNITQQQSNWHSAASSTGFGTPGRSNSQAITILDNERKLLVPSTNVISPDQDGYQDFVILNYMLEKAGYLATIEVYTLTGTRVATVANNELCGTRGFFKWDGWDMHWTTLPQGNYIILCQFIHPEGQIRRDKIPIAIWRRLTK